MIIFISGSINSGKSTVARILANNISNTALLEIDSLCECIAWMPIDQSVPINLENAVSLIKNFVKRDLNVIVPYPLSRKNYDYMVDALSGLGVDMHAFILSPDLQSVLGNRGERELTGWELERIRHHYAIGINNPGFGIVIDNTHKTSQETADAILKEIFSGNDGKQNIVLD